jgi:DNA-binding winged helix-turn-helix (wHTH) protein
MPHHRAWTDYHPDYRAPQMRTLADWIAAGQSGSVVGMGGAGKSNLLGFLAHRPEVLDGYLPDGERALAVLVDLNILPAADLATVYRLFLRSFHQLRSRLDAPLAAEIERTFTAQLTERDPFVVHTALLDWLTQLTDSGLQVALVMDRFDRFAEHATPELTDSLRAIRDAFKGRLCLLAGMRQPAAYLPDPSVLGELQELLDTRICWVGTMNDADARRMIGEETALADPQPAEDEMTALVELTGGYPALLKAACHWWLDGGQELPRETWEGSLAGLPGIRTRMGEIWAGLTLAEQAALAAAIEAESSAAARRAVASEHDRALHLLREKGLLEGDAQSGWAMRGRLLAMRASGQVHRRGQLKFDEATGEINLGATPLRDLTNLERSALAYLLARPRARIAKTELIEGVWPDDAVEDGVMDDALYQVVRGLRRKIEPEPGKPRFLVTWRGRPEGGYQLFPEGRPG